MADKVRLTWSEGAPSQPGTGFKIHRSVNGGAFSHVAILPLSQTSWEEYVNYGNTYTYRVYEYLSLPNGDVLSLCAARTISLKQGLQTTAGQELWRAFKTIPQEETSSSSDTGRLTARLYGLEQSGSSDSGALLAKVFGIDQSPNLSETARLVEAFFTSLDSGGGEEEITAIFRGYFVTSSDDSAEGEEESLVRALLSALDQALGGEQGALEAVLFSVDTAGGKERPVFIFVKQTGEPWGLVEVGLGPIQRK